MPTRAHVDSYACPQSLDHAFSAIELKAHRRTFAFIDRNGNGTVDEVKRDAQ